MAYSVAQRTQEFGIRLALGAGRGAVLSLVLGRGIQLALYGLALGFASASLLTGSMSSLLFGVKPNDPFTFFAIAALLFSIALLACLLPARRATKIDPIIALRAE
jgi:putative ABC transport system permease protein